MNAQLKLLVKEIKLEKNKFNTYATKVKIIVKGEEEKGKQDKWLTVKFRRNVDTKNITNGCIITADIDAPIIYQLTRGENNKIIYPEIWVHEITNIIHPLKRKIKDVEELKNKIEFVLNDNIEEETEIK